ncbi:MAG: phosphoribosylaminoimidazolesuccinocarboxamide synthase [Deltaproteobacteria bacterium]|nr:MAG: phosphoribosylaminoimidazolesuccinocarboxamide synthase [Deltaproteobacteria bacterium]
MSTTSPLYEGKAKSLYTTDREGILVQRFKDSATAFNGRKFATLPGKGALNNRISSILFRLLRESGIDSHYVDTRNTRDMGVRAVRIVPLEVVVRNVVAGSLSTRLGLDEGVALRHPIVELYYKRDDLGDPMICMDHAAVMQLATDAELQQLKRMALEVNDVLQPLWASAELTLVDFKLEFGRTDSGLLLADEISPDTSRLWDRTDPSRRMDKDVFRRDLGDLVETYTEVLRRLLTVAAAHDPGELTDAPSDR